MPRTWGLTINQGRARGARCAPLAPHGLPEVREADHAPPQCELFDPAAVQHCPEE